MSVEYSQGIPNGRVRVSNNDYEIHFDVSEVGVVLGSRIIDNG